MKIILIFLLAMSGVCAAQQINPSQIRPCATNGYILATVSGVTSCVPPPTTAGVITGTGTSGYIPQWTGTSTQGNSPIDYGVTKSGTVTVNAPMDVTGQVVASSLFSEATLAYHTDCSTVGNVSFALNYVSNGDVSGPVSASITTAGVCPTVSDYSLGPWVTNALAVAEGSGITFSNCGQTAFCAPGTGANQVIQTEPTAPTGTCPGAVAGTNDAIWVLSADDKISFCTNQTGSTWQLYSPGGGGTGLSGMTSGQVPIANSATTANASKAIAGSGAALTSGPTTAVSGDVTTMSGTTGQIADSGTLLASLAPLASPALTGTPTAPTATVGTNTTQVATTAFVIANAGSSGSVIISPTSVSCGGGGSVTVTGTKLSTYDVEILVLSNGCTGTVAISYPALTNAPSLFIPYENPSTVVCTGSLAASTTTSATLDSLVNNCVYALKGW